MRRHASLLAAALAAVAVSPTVAAAPAQQQGQQPPNEILAEFDLGKDSPIDWAGAADTGGVNAWTHLSLWDGNTCYSDSPDNKCDRLLVHTTDAGTATFTMTPDYPVSDYDLVIYESGPDGDAFTIVGHNQNEMYVESEGPIPLPGPETIELDVKKDYWYLAVVFYRAGGGGYSLTGELA